SDIAVVWTVITFIAVVGGGYAIFGGLKAVAVSDTFNGVGLLIGGLLITVLSWQAIMGPDDTVFSVVDKIKQQNPDAFQSLGKEGEDVHWPTLFTGVLLLNFFYWCSNQQIIQRSFAAKNLAEGQKGVLIAAFFKILAPFALILPGIIAAYLVTQDPEFAAKVGGVANKSYGALVSKVLPEWLVGFFAAVVVGAILSTFNSVLNSAATLFSLDVYKRFIRPTASMKEVVFSGQACSLLVGVLAVVAAPLIFHGKDGVFGFFQKLNGVYFIPLLAIMMVGLFNKWADGRSALVTFFVGLAAMSVGTFATWPGKDLDANGKALDPGWVVNWFGSGYHFMGVVFVVLVVLQLGLGSSLMRRLKPYIQHDVGAVDLTPWKPAPYVGGALVAFVLGIYVYFAVI
ncbi:MAG: solute:sodium symporter family transporter, partial [Pirellulaceae bacterium]|nr:solute:sodium symporter family transporter [Pirellulaceae bacterium]